MVGKTLSHYEILEQLGAGGMGEVYRARDVRLDRLVALKILPAALSEDVERLARFEREARTLAQINHPNIVTIHSVEQVGEHRFLTMELVQGRTLADEIGSHGMPLSRFLELGRALAAALAAAHASGITHRDLKPANVMVTRDGQIKVLDFGLAKQAGGEDGVDLTRHATELVTKDGMVVGTVPYMSPEQIEGRAVDHRSDVFSMGVLFYEMVTGQRPFRGPSQPAVMSSILRDTPVQVLEVRPGLPRHLDRILHRCLEKDPGRRYQSAASLVYELEQLEAESATDVNGKRARSVDRAESPVGSREDAPAASPELRTRLAVLPFMNRGGDPDDQYFTDGLSEELINALGMRRGLRVTARSSSFQFRGRETDAREVGERLDVEVVLEGSVRIAGERLRVTTELVSCRDGALLWSDRFDGQMRDIFDTQDEIVQAVVSQLDVRLGASDEFEIKQREPDNLEAYHLFLKGRHHAAEWGGPGLVRAIDILEQAIALEPGYALAYGELALCHVVSGIFGDAKGRDALERARTAATRALEIDPEIDVAHATRGMVGAMQDMEWEAAEASLRKALALNPNSAWNHFYYACFLCMTRRYAETIEHTQRMVALDPLNPIMRAHRIEFLAFAGRTREAMAEADSAREDFPTHWFVSYVTAFAPWLERDAARARDAFDRAIELSGGRVGAPLYLRAAVAFDFGDTADGDGWLARLHELEASHPDAASPTLASVVEVFRGNTDEAVRLLEQARAERDPLFAWARAGWCRPFDNDESFVALLKGLGLP